MVRKKKHEHGIFLFGPCSSFPTSSIVKKQKRPSLGNSDTQDREPSVY